LDVRRFLAVITLLLVNIALYAYWRLGPTPASAPPAAMTSAPVQTQAPVAVKPEPLPPCVDVGPFADREVASAALDWFAQRGATATVREAQVDAPPEFAVEASARSVDLAARTVQALHAAGLEEAEIQPADDGGSSVTIALGVFPDQRHAEHRVAIAKRFGITARIVRRARTQAAWWLDLEAQEAPDLAALKTDVPAAAGVTSGSCPLPLPLEESTPETPAEIQPPKSAPTVPQTRV
jgi:hypothetical protein